jgi:hypothetical protein
MRSATRPTYNAEPINSEVVSDSLNIIGGVCDDTIFSPIGAGIAGPIIADKADAESVEDNSSWARASAHTWGSVKQKHWLSPRVAQSFNRQLVPIWNLNHVRHDSLHRIVLLPRPS